MPFEEVPAAHWVQLELVVVDPAAYPLPAAQEVWLQEVQEATLVDVEKLFDPQAPQVRFTVALGVFVTYWPAVHVDQGEQLPAPAPA